MNLLQVLPDDIVFNELFIYLEPIDLVFTLETLDKSTIVRYIHKFYPKLYTLTRKAGIPRNHLHSVLYYHLIFENYIKEYHIRCEDFKINNSYYYYYGDQYDFNSMCYICQDVSPEMYSLTKLHKDTGSLHGPYSPHYFYLTMLAEYRIYNRVSALEQILGPESAKILLTAVYIAERSMQYNSNNRCGVINNTIDILHRYLIEGTFEYINPEDYSKIMQWEQDLFWVVYLHYLESLVRGYLEPQESIIKEITYGIIPEYRKQMVEILRNPLVLGKLDFGKK